MDNPDFLPKNTCLGDLEIFDIYDYYDGPRLFSATNNLGHLYLVYWCDETDESDGWLYLPVSKSRLRSLIRNKISINDAYSEPEAGGVYLVYTYINHECDTAQFYRADLIDNKFIPPVGHYFGLENESEIILEDEWSHELVISKANSKSLPSAEAVTRMLGAWRESIESIMNHLARSQKIYPVSAEPGSFEVKFTSTDNKLAEKAISQLSNIVNGSNKNLRENLFKIHLEPHKLRAIYDVTRRYNLKISVNVKLKEKSSINIDISSAERWIERLEPITSSIVGTDKIPQADDLDKVIDLIEKKNRKFNISADSLNLTPRQVNYYLHAAQVLGLLDEDKYLTSVSKLLLSQECEDRYRILANRFESSECGWSWVSWSNGRTILDIDSNTAFSFLTASAPGLSQNTAKRRAKTLTSWVNKLKKYHYLYKV